MICKLIKYTLILIILTWLYNVILFLDLNKTVYNHTPEGGCHHIPGIVNGSEDMQLMYDGGVLITSGILYGLPEHKFDYHGKIYALFIDDVVAGRKSGIVPAAKEVFIRVIRHLDLKTFTPHGITAWGQKVYIINHGIFGEEPGDSIEVFYYSGIDASPVALTHQRCIRHKNMVSLNDLVVVDEDILFASNDNYYRNLKMKELAMFSMLPHGNLIHIHEFEVDIVDSPLSSPNGLAFDRTTSTVYLSLIGSRAVRAYKYSPKSGTIRHQFDMSLGTMPDNLQVDGHGDVWVGCHPIAWKVARHLKDWKTYKAPSQVLRISEINMKSKSYEVTQFYADDGRQLSGSAVGIFSNSLLFIGSVTDKAMVCYL